MEKLKNRIVELEACLLAMHPEDMAISVIQTDLRKAKEDLELLENPKPIEDERK